MKKIFCSLFIYFFWSGILFSQQTVQWTETFSGPGVEDVFGVATDASGNLVVASMFTSTLDADPGPGTFTVNTNGIEDIGISKIDPNGNLIWAKTIGSTGMEWVYGTALDLSGNVYVIGTFSNIMDFDPGPGTFTLSNINGNCFVLKLDAAGNFIWAKNYGSASPISIFGITTDPIGDVYVTGYFYNTVDFDPGLASYTLTATGQDAYVSKLSSSGNFIWAKKLGDTGNDASYAVKTDASGNVLFTGRFLNTVDFDPGPGTFTLTSAGSEDIYLCKLDPAGNFLMAKGTGGAGIDRALDLSIDASGNIIIGGIFSATSDFDPGSGTFNLTPVGSNDFFILKLSSTGNFVWAKACGSTLMDAVTHLTNDAAGNIYAVGYFETVIDFDPGPGTYTVNSNGNYDGFALKLTASGNFDWVVPMGSSNYDLPTCVVEDGSGNVYTGGYFQGFTDFDPGPILYGFTPLGGQDAFIQKIGYCTSAPIMPSAIMGTSLFCTGSASMSLNYSVAPLPGANYSWTVPAGWSGSSTTNSLSVISGTSGVISVVATNSCGISPTQTLNIIMDTLPIINVISSSSLICAGQTVTLTASGASSYSWMPGSFSGNPVAPSPTVTTNYTITGTSVYGCSNSSTVTQNVSACTEVSEALSEIDLKIYPNPSNGDLFIETLKEYKMTVTDMVGQQILSAELKFGMNSISINDKSAGIYFLKIVNGSEERVFKLIKN